MFRRPKYSIETKRFRERAMFFSMFDRELSSMRFVPILNTGGSIAQNVAANIREYTMNGRGWDMDIRSIY